MWRPQRDSRICGRWKSVAARIVNSDPRAALTHSLTGSHPRNPPPLSRRWASCRRSGINDVIPTPMTPPRGPPRPSRKTNADTIPNSFPPYSNGMIFPAICPTCGSSSGRSVIPESPDVQTFKCGACECSWSEPAHSHLVDATATRHPHWTTLRSWLHLTGRAQHKPRQKAWSARP